MQEKLRILIADDDKNLREGLRTVLDAEGHYVDIAGYGEEALELAGQAVYDLYILDLRMPGLDGVETFEKLCSFDNTIPSILITGQPDEEVIARSVTVGILGYLEKPFKMETLLSLIDKVWQEKKRRLGE